MRTAILFAIFAIILTACGSEIPPGYFSETDTISSSDDTKSNDTFVTADTMSKTDVPTDTYVGYDDTTVVEDTSPFTDTMVEEEDTFVAQDTYEPPADTSVAPEDTTVVEDTYMADTDQEDTTTGQVGPCPKDFQPGDLLLPSGTGKVYLLDENKERMIFPQQEVYNSWYSDFLGIHLVSTECLVLYPLRSEGPVLVGYRPGNRILKDAVALYVYVILPGSSIAQVSSPQLLESIYGEDWSERIVNADEIAMANYKIGEPLNVTLPHDGMLVRDKDQPENDSVWYVKDGQLVEILGGAGFWQSDVISTQGATLDQMSVSQETMTMEDVLNELREQL